MKPVYAQRLASLKASEIRELLKLTESSDIISFAGGLPAPELFPVAEISEICAMVLQQDGQHALQYTTTEGYQPLRKWIACRMNSTQGTNFGEDNILITNGSQQALDLTGKVFLDEGDVVLCESPTYLAAITAFKAYGCRFVEVPTDDGGMNMEALAAILKRTEKVKVVYVIPNFQNPTGRTMNLERRKRLAELAAQHNVVVLEDNPYGELRFEGDALPAVQSFDKEGCVLATGTFSKILCPGLRVGWVAGPEEIVQKYTLVKQGCDLQSNTFTQRVIAAYLENYDIDAHITKILQVYRKRRDVTLAAMSRFFTSEVSFTHPEGGLFVWVTAPEGVHTPSLLEECIAKKVAFVPGGSFFPGGGHDNTMRINFSTMDEERIVRGMEILASVLRQYGKNAPSHPAR